MCPEITSIGARKARVHRRSLRLAPVALLALLTLPGCGGSPGGDTVSAERPAIAATSLPVGGQTTTSAPGKPELDLSPPPAIDGFANHQGSCDGFPLHLQYPDDWQTSSTSSTFGTRRIEDDDDTFSVNIVQDVGSAHVATQTAMFRQGGARTVGEISIAGRTVEVLGGAPGTYHLFAPHPWGGGLVGYYSIAVQSSLGDAETLRILDSLAPVEGCVE